MCAAAPHELCMHYVSAAAASARGMSVWMGHFLSLTSEPHLLSMPGCLIVSMRHCRHCYVYTSTDLRRTDQKKLPYRKWVESKKT